MDYIGNIDTVLQRTDLRQIRSFIMSGTNDFAEDVRPYSDTLKNGSVAISQRLESLYPDGKELDNANDDLYQALTAYENVYMELGIKAGARLLWQLLSDNPQPTTKEDNCEK